ncbi:MAG: HAD family hydrolase [Dehalococcoidia bacterium]|nr:HAD family hydrolase [Dehalococcoidia bacterium]
MSRIKVISFDAEGTLVTPGFSQAIWHEVIPSLYAGKSGIELASAKEIVAQEYNKVGDQRLEWYDIEYWFRYFRLGSAELAIQSCQAKVSYYPEVMEVLSSLEGQYKLIVASGTPSELLEPQLLGIKNYFLRIFSSVSLCKQLKTPEFYAYVCELMKVNPGQIVHVGDNWQFDFVNSSQVGINAFHLDRVGNSQQGSLADLTELKSHLS